MTQVRKIADTRRFNFVPAPVGHEHHTSPESKRGLVESCNRRKIKIWCSTCQTLRAISECIDILKELDEEVVYLVRLAECDHQRIFEQAVNRTPSGKKKLQEEKARAAAAKKKLESSGGCEEPVAALDSDEDVDAIRIEMRESGVLNEPDEDEDETVRELGIEQTGIGCEESEEQ
jgi:hypothetical protein